MIFTNAQIQDILGILKRWELVFIGNQLGANYLSPSEKAILKAAGIDVNQFTNSQGIIEHAFLFGLLSEAIGHEQAAKMNYQQFQKFLKSGNFIPLSENERFALEQMKNRSYNDITGLGSRMATSTSNIIIRANITQANKIKDIIKDKAQKAVILRQGATTLAGELGEATGDWERDWLRIAYYLTHEAFNAGRAQSILKEYGTDAEVYFDVFPGACKHCKRLYLTDPDDPESEPIIFKLGDVINNGNNIGRRTAEWLPTISPTHPYCRCILNHKRKGYGWNPELNSFTTVTKYVPTNKKLQGVKLDIKVSKSDDIDIEKARSGVYSDTPENRRLQRVGQPYGIKKNDGAYKST